jgi:hypothetical protein
MRVTAIMGLAACVGACAQPTSPLASSYDKHIGKRYWVTPDQVLLCSRPGTDCAKMKSGSFDVKEFVSPYYLRVETPGGISGYIFAVDDEHFLIEDPALTAEKARVAALDCKRRGNPRIGMTGNQVIATCWGKPEHVNRTQTGTSTFDQYVYSDDRFLYFRDGVLTSMQVTGQLAR